jgi:hypothetical protein
MSMLQTYKAVLRGDRLEWHDQPPTTIDADQPVAVHVTILDDTSPEAYAPAPGHHMAEILEQLAQLQALPDITDPVAWERTIRMERSLPNRDA